MRFFSIVESLYGTFAASNVGSHEKVALVRLQTNDIEVGLNKMEDKIVIQLLLVIVGRGES